MNRLNSSEYLTGFLMGVFLGFFFESIFIIIYNLFCAWRGSAPLELVWWMMVPVPLVFGMIMAKAIADLHLEDY